MAEAHNPLHQFEIQTLIQLPPLGQYNIDFTNSSLFMVLAVLSSFLFMYFSMSKKALVPGRWQMTAELIYGFVAGTVRDYVGNEGKKYFPFIFTLFMFVLFSNLLGMIPYSFTVTSHIIVTFALAIVIFLGVTLIAIIKHGPIKFLAFFLPKGTPWWMAPLMYFIELFAYLARPVSLSIRLAANMMAGHLLMKVVAGLIIMFGFAAGWVPFLFLIGVTGFEIFVAILQAYIFTVLTCVYLNDALHLH